jgi:hypothetical protein
MAANRTEGLDFDHCAAVMQTLGRFHALSFAMKDQDPEGFKTIATCLKVCFSMNKFISLHLSVFCF